LIASRDVVLTAVDIQRFPPEAIVPTEIQPPPEPAKRDSWPCRHRWGSIVIVLAAIGWFVVGAVVYGRNTPHTTNIVKVELAGDAVTIKGLIAADPGAYRGALRWDYAFIAGYGVAILAILALARSICFTPMWRRISTGAFFATLVAIICDVGEDEFLRPVLRSPVTSRQGLAVTAQAFSFVKWSLILPVAAVTIVAALTVLWRGLGVDVDDGLRRLLGRPRSAERTDKGTPSVSRPSTDPNPDVTDAAPGNRSAWLANSQLPAARRPNGKPDEIGFCVSGGGIRSATLALGALDALRPLLTQARYLVSVSGGGYATGAMQLALQSVRNDTKLPPELEGGDSVAAPADVYTGGSAELDHTRKHGRYLADGAKEWVVAVVRLLRGLLVNLLTLGLSVIVIGRVVGHVYAYLPGNVLRTGTWHLPAGVIWAVCATLALALGLFVIRVWFAPSAARTNSWLKTVETSAFGLGVLLAVLGIGLPLLAWVSHQRPPGAPAAAGGTLSVLSAWFATIVAFGKRPAVSKDAEKVWARFSKGSSKPRGWMANGAVILALLIVTVSLLFLLGVVLSHTGTLSARPTWAGGPTWLKDRPEWFYTLIAAAILGFFATVDQVRWSLHPFYRRRLATAFAVRRVRSGQRVDAVPYNYDSEGTPLHQYAQQHENDDGKEDFPQVIFSCAAHDSDTHTTAPGRRVVPWTMSSDYVGSPQIGWVATADLHSAVAPALQSDLTVEAAQAISGAAIAAQMGRMNHSYTRLLVLANAQLGSWLPNPRYLQQRAAEGEAWWLPRLPRRRYLSTFARELLGSYPGDSPLLYVTDGGHYENLGLVELLRHRPRWAICIDASGDKPDIPTTLAQAIQLAYEELGVVISAPQAAGLGAGPDVTRPAAENELVGELKDRLSSSCVITAQIQYPDLGPGLPSQEGTLFFGKATLTDGLPLSCSRTQAVTPRSRTTAPQISGSTSRNSTPTTGSVGTSGSSR
jgi:hypothetical protein